MKADYVIIITRNELANLLETSALALTVYF